MPAAARIAFAPAPLMLELENSVALAEGLGCGPLAIAVLEGNVQAAQSILKSSPNAIEELDCFGNTPLHMAAIKNRLPLFPFLLERAMAAKMLERDIQQGNKPRECLLKIALTATNQICRNGSQFRECTSCNCSESLEMLLSAGAVLKIDDLQSLRSNQSPSAKGLKVFFTHLKVQREQLQDIAQRNEWAIRDHLSLIQNDRLLDLHASTIYKALTSNYIGTPPNIAPLYQTSVSRIATNHPKLVYHFIPENPQLAEWVFQMGFQDVDFDIKYGKPPLTHAEDPDYLTWLLQKGANLERRIWPREGDQSNTHGVFSAHFVMFRLGWFPEWHHPIDANTLASITARILPLSLADLCYCFCSAQGCTPFVYLLKGSNLPFYAKEASRAEGKKGIYEYTYWKRLRDIAEYDLITLSHGIPTEIVRSLYLAAVRFLCFCLLDLTHTCCKAREVVRDDYHYVVREQNDVEEIQQEESELLDVLEEMVDEFKNRTEQVPAGDAAHLQACWQDYWLHYVPNALRYNRMTEEEREKAEMIGVVWTTETVDREAASSSGAKPEEEMVENTLRKYIRKLDLIT
ncbi:hypothetical protein PG990_002789 [Apiospora arundinis]